MTLRLNHAHVSATDIPRAVAYYERLGSEPVVLEAHYARFLLPDGGSTFSVHLAERADAVGAAGAAIHLECESAGELDATVAELQAAGVVFDSGPVDMPYLWREATLRDPDWNTIVLYHAGENRLNPPWRVQR